MGHAGMAMMMMMTTTTTTTKTQPPHGPDIKNMTANIINPKAMKLYSRLCMIETAILRLQFLHRYSVSEATPISASLVCTKEGPGDQPPQMDLPS